MTSFAIMLAALAVAALYFGRIASSYIEAEKARKELRKILEDKEVRDD